MTQSDAGSIKSRKPNQAMSYGAEVSGDPKRMFGPDVRFQRNFQIHAEIFMSRKGREQWQEAH